jgi:hypothetical protein
MHAPVVVRFRLMLRLPSLPNPLGREQSVRPINGGAGDINQSTAVGILASVMQAMEIRGLHRHRRGITIVRSILSCIMASMRAIVTFAISRAAGAKWCQPISVIMGGRRSRLGAGLHARATVKQMEDLPSLQRREHLADDIVRDECRAVWIDEMTFGEMGGPA